MKLNCIIESTTTLYKGLLDPDAISDFNKLERYIKMVGNFSQSYADGEKCNGKRFIAHDNAIEILKTVTKPGYFTLIFDGYEVIVIFNNKTIKLNVPWSSDEFDKLVEYGKKEGLDRKYFDGIIDSMKTFERWR